MRITVHKFSVVLVGVYIFSFSIDGEITQCHTDTPAVVGLFKSVPSGIQI